MQFNSNVATKQIMQFLKDNYQTIALAESCSGGLIAYQFSKISGASAVFRGGIISYQNEIKSSILKISPEIIRQHSPYSEIVVRKMLDSTLTMFECDFAITVSGIAGPTGGSETMPVGTVFVGIADKNQHFIEKCQFSGSRVRIQRDACNFALNFFISNFIPI